MLAPLDLSRARSRSSERPSPRPWLLLFAAALAIRVVVVLLGNSAVMDGPRAPEWLPVARSLANGGGFAVANAAGPAPTAAFPPLAPWIASGVMKVGRGSPLALPLAFAVLGALVSLVIGALGMSVFGANVGRWAGWICALDPQLLFTRHSSDTLVPLLVALAAVCTASWVKTPRPGRALGVGLMWGAAALSNPAVLGFPLGVIAWAWVPLGLTVQPSDRLRQAALVLAGVAIVVAPWTLRNASALRAFVPVSTGSGMAFLAANDHRAWTDPALAGISRPDLAADHPEVRAGGEVRNDRMAFRLALDHIRAHPGESLRVLPRRLLEFAVAPRPLDWRIAVGSLVLLPFFAWGAVRAVTGPRRIFQSFAVLTIGAFLAIGMIYGANAGVRTPAEPLVALLAGVGLDDLRLRLRARAHGFAVIEGRR